MKQRLSEGGLVAGSKSTNINTLKSIRSALCDQQESLLSAVVLEFNQYNKTRAYRLLEQAITEIDLIISLEII